MIRPQLIAESMDRIAVVNNLTAVFQSIASMQIARIKRQVESSQGFFNELWQLYTALRFDPRDYFASEGKITTDKQLFIAITAEGGFSGDIDQKLINWMLEGYNAKTTDIICIGHHGAIQLAQAGIGVVQYFKLPPDDQRMEVTSMIDLIERYPSTTAYYQTYVSLAVQDVKRISLQTAVKQLSAEAEKEEELITARTYIFEPTEEDVISYLESTMLGIALSQVILESKLAQYASRFRAMSQAHDKAIEIQDDLKLEYYRAKRAAGDERMKEVMAGLQRLRRGATS